MRPHLRPSTFATALLTCAALVAVGCEQPPPAPPTLTVETFGGGEGIVVVEPNGVVCEGHCEVDIRPGAVVQLVALPGAGSHFLGFGGDEDCVGGEVRMDRRARARRASSWTATGRRRRWTSSGSPSSGRAA